MPSEHVNNPLLRQKTSYVSRVLRAMRHVEGFDLPPKYRLSAYETLIGEMRELQEMAEVEYREQLERKRKKREG